MLLSNTLWESNYELALLSLKSKFVQGLKTGNLPKNIFQEYVAQDYYFLESFSRAYGLAVSKSKDKNSIKVLSQLLVGVSEELILHETYAKEWDIDLTNNYIKPATKNYTAFLDEVSKKQNAVEIMFAMTPCMRLYSWIGKSLSKNVLNNPYKEWIITYSDKNFDNLAKSLENLIDSSKEEYDFNQANYLYKRAMELELEFFNAYSNF
ncbi:TenA family protein [uncultured Prochlorococcus sp.]|jgi:thiaminase/transcriptional activator TenA|uniref:TenA family protein n=1 Tax=Prochlorococcus sp. TaxID=1220 RepID=UPI000C42EAA9|nr:TenA family protein [uncultured Prochlorococcus sp.]MAK08806.1 TenA family transcriptional regulator [Prochlorococcus sp. MED105]RCL48948.1 MAG: TenA family transcriptional regulator [Prochlorococcus sp. MED-G72]|tara:strand:+ start:39 stop:662 length:624 start_codon:yes stop_codon:yes gene_type:complete